MARTAKFKTYSYVINCKKAIFTNQMAFVTHFSYFTFKVDNGRCIYLHWTSLYP